MQLDKLRAGLEIFSKYFKDAAGSHTGAEHDVFYVYATDTPIASDDLDKLVELGWHQPEVDVEDNDGEFLARHYDPEEGWAAFT